MAQHTIIGLDVSLALFLIAVFTKLTCRLVRAIEDIADRLDKLLGQTEQKNTQPPAPKEKEA